MTLIRYDDNRIDKILATRYLYEFKKVIDFTTNLTHLNEYRQMFTNNFCKNFHLNGGLPVNSGTDAIHLAFLASGIKKGDEVIISNLDYPSGIFVIRLMDLKSIIIDVNEELKVDPKVIQDAITDETKAILVSNMFGKVNDLDSINKVAKNNGCVVIEDCCQSLGSIYESEFCGTKSDFSCFSFAHIKPFASLGGNGGFIGCNKDNVAKIESFYQIWKGKKQLLDLFKNIARMNLLDMASVNVKLSVRDKILKSRLISMRLYNDLLKSIDDVEIFKDSKKEKSIMQSYLILTERRDALFEYLKLEGIMPDLPFIPLNKLEISEELDTNNKFPNTERYYEHGIHLPLFSFMKEEEVGYVVKTIKDFFSN